MARVPLTSVDTAWLRMEDPTNLMMITGVMLFGTPIDHDRLRQVIEQRLLRFDRFRQRVVQPEGILGQAFWEDDPDFDLDQHLQCTTLPPPGDDAALRRLVSSLMSTQLDFSKPLWRMDLIEGYDGGSAVVARLHHCIADGIALVQVILSLADDAPEPEAPGGDTAVHPAALDPREPADGFDAVAAAGRAAAEYAGKALNGAGKLLTRPSRLLDLVKKGVGASGALGKLTLRSPDARTIFKGPLQADKVAAWSQPVSLAEVKEVGRWFKATVNDVLLSAVSGALRSYLQARRQSVSGLNIRAVVPVNLRPPGAALELGNRFSLVFLSLPIGVGDPIERLLEVNRRMNGLKGSQEPAVAFGLLHTIGMVPEQIQRIVIDIFGTKGTAVMTNVPGPRETIYLAGAPVDMMMAWVPQSGHLGMGVSIVSYAGQVRLGVTTDHGLVPDPEAIVAEFEVCFAELLELVRRKARPRSRSLLEMMNDVSQEMDVLISELDATEDERAAKS